MDSGGAFINSALDQEITAKAKEKPLVFDVNKIDTQISFILKMKVQITSEHSTQTRPLRDLAILYKRFALNAGIIVKSVPLQMQTSY